MIYFYSGTALGNLRKIFWMNDSLQRLNKSKLYFFPSRLTGTFIFFFEFIHLRTVGCGPLNTVVTVDASV